MSTWTTPSLVCEISILVMAAASRSGYAPATARRTRLLISCATTVRSMTEGFGSVAAVKANSTGKSARPGRRLGIPLLPHSSGEPAPYTGGARYAKSDACRLGCHGRSAGARDVPAQLGILAVGRRLNVGDRESFTRCGFVSGSRRSSPANHPN
jgi:hypothetical protein